MENTALPPWRSLLFVPADNDRFIVGAAKRGADAVILDLEDGVLPENKEAARRAVPDAARSLRSAGLDVTVRINQPLRAAVPDLEAAVCGDVAAIVVPKAVSASHLSLLDELVSELERERGLPEGRISFVAMIETASALERMTEIAHAPRVIGLSIGNEDLAFSLGMIPSADSLYVPNVMAVAAARAANRLPIGYLASVAAMDDLEAFRTLVRRSRHLGLAAGMCIHPTQVSILNEEFAPSPAEVEEAEAIVQAFAEASRKGLGAARHRGRMIDRPVVERARNVLDLHARLRARADAGPPRTR